MDADSTTPKIALLLSRLQTLNLEVTKSINKIVQRLDTFDPPIELKPALENIVDRKKEKERHQKSYKVNLKEVVDTGIDYELLG